MIEPARAKEAGKKGVVDREEGEETQQRTRSFYYWWRVAGGACATADSRYAMR